MSIVFDLDETLLHTCCRRYDTCEFSFPFEDLIVNVRNGFSNLISYLESTNFKIYVFSAGTAEYVRDICEMIFPPNFLSGYWSRDHCISHELDLYKMLPSKFNIEQTIIVDDRADIYKNYEKLIKIRINPMDDCKDNSLINLIPILNSYIMKILLLQ